VPAHLGFEGALRAIGNTVFYRALDLIEKIMDAVEEMLVGFHPYISLAFSINFRIFSCSASMSFRIRNRSLSARVWL
jgi:hypothetical protein